MAERDENFEEKEDQSQESALEVTELDDQALEDVAGGNTYEERDSFGGAAATNQNCGVC